MSAAILCAALAFTPRADLMASRRELFTRIVAAGAVAAGSTPAAHAVSARTGMSSPFTGEYDDPNHPGCLRSVKVVGAKLGADGRKGRNPVAYISGVDGLPAGTKSCPDGERPELKDVWKLEGKVSEDGESVAIDFSPKTNGRVGLLVGKYDTIGGAGISFPDGNKWIKVEGGTPKRRPVSVTLNSGD